MSRKIRRKSDTMLAGLGIAFVFTAVLLGASIGIYIQMPMALFGVLLMEAGVWGLAQKILPSDRHYSRLREEGNHMLDLVRDLNAAAIAKDLGNEDAKRFQATLEKMHESVVTMSELAALEDGAKLPATDDQSDSNI